MVDTEPQHDSGGSPDQPALAFWDRADSIRPYLKQVAAGLLRGPLAAKLDPSDLVQLALLRAHEQASQFRGRTFAEWLGWLVAIVRNESLDAVRHYGQEMRNVRREEPLPAAGRVPERPAESPSEQAVRREQAAAVLAALEHLAEDYRRVLDLRAFQDLSYLAIAEQMGRSEEAVRQLWVRAVRRLRREMGEEP